jgi:hypothetical protein
MSPDLVDDRFADLHANGRAELKPAAVRANLTSAIVATGPVVLSVGALHPGTAIGATRLRSTALDRDVPIADGPVPSMVAMLA